jgi:hypothetical protein
MNTKNLLIASLVGAFITIVLTNVPIISVVNCLLCAGFWAGPLFATWMYRRQTGTLTLGQGIGIGTLAGVWAAIVGFLIATATGVGSEAMIQSYSQFIPADSGLTLPAPGVMSVFASLIGAGFGVFFGFLGGLIGGAIFKSPPTTLTPAA